MEVREESVDDLKFEGRMNKNVCASSPHIAARALQNADRRSADRDHAAAFALCRFDRARTLFGNHKPLLVHRVLFEVVGLHGREGAKAHVQGDERGFDTTVAQFLESLRREMQTGRGRSYRAAVSRK